MEDGKRVIAAPVRAAHVDAFDLFHERLATEGLKLSTAVHNSARFPFVSPPAFIEQRGQQATDALEPWGRVVDGGYFENSGAETAREIVEQIAAAQGGRRSNIHVLILSNAPRNPEERLCHEILQEAGNTAPPLCRADTVKGDAPPNAWLPDLNAPAEALMATREARGSMAKAQLAQAIGDASRVHELYLAKWGHAYTDPPLGWFLSGQGITGIDDALSPTPKSVKEPQPARLALQRLAWQLVMPVPYAPGDDAATLERKRARFLCERAGLKDCPGERI